MRAYGANAVLAGAFETEYGSPPAGGFIQLPFISSSLGSTQGLIENDVLGQGRDPMAPMRDVINADGDVQVPIDLRVLGHWLRLLLGDPETTDAAPVYSHEFASGRQSLPSMSMEIGMPEVPRFIMVEGVRANSMQIQWQRAGGASATFNCIAQGEAQASASQAGTAETLDYRRFNQFEGEIRRGGQALANCVSGSLTYSNNLERVEVIRSDGKIADADPTRAALTGSIEARFSDAGLLDLAIDGEPTEMSFRYQIDADRRLVITAHEVFLPKPKASISGPGGVQVTFDWRAARRAAAGRMMTVELTNDVEAYA